MASRTVLWRLTGLRLPPLGLQSYSGQTHGSLSNSDSSEKPCSMNSASTTGFMVEPGSNPVPPRPVARLTSEASQSAPAIIATTRPWSSRLTREPSGMSGLLGFSVLVTVS